MYGNGVCRWAVVWVVTPSPTPREVGYRQLGNGEANFPYGQLRLFGAEASRLWGPASRGGYARGCGVGYGRGRLDGLGVVLGVSLSVSVKDGGEKKLRQKCDFVYKFILPSGWISPLFVFMTCESPPRTTLSKKKLRGGNRANG